MTRPDSRFAERWIELPDGQSMCALINGDVGWLMILRFPGDVGMSSRNPAYDGPDDRTIEYFLDNGQRDEYPASWALPIEEIQKAMAFFEENQQIPDFVTWHDDEED